MSAEIRRRQLRRAPTLAVAAVALGVMVVPLAPANAQIYPGWDFGGGVGIGIGPPPSAYTPCPNYGWPVYPYPCAYYGRTHHSHHYRHSRHYSRESKPPTSGSSGAPSGSSTEQLRSGR